MKLLSLPFLFLALCAFIDKPSPRSYKYDQSIAKLVYVAKRMKVETPQRYEVNAGYRPLADQKLPKPKIYDLQGNRLHELSSGRHVDSLFDGLQYHDPKYNFSALDTNGWSTGMFPQRPAAYHKKGPNVQGMYYPGDERYKMIFDFVGDKDIFRKLRVNLSSIYGLMQGGDGLDTMWFYNADFIIDETMDGYDKLKRIARHDSLLTPIGYLVNIADINFFPRWVAHITSTDSLRYMMVTFREKNRGSFFTWPNFSELVFYGEPRYNTAIVNKLPDVYTGLMPVNRPAGLMLGTNNAGVYDSVVKRSDHLNRGYQAFTDYADINVGTYATSTWNFNRNNAPLSQLTQHFVDVPSTWGMYWVSIRGGSVRLANQLSTIMGHTVDPIKIMPLDNPFDDPEDPWSYEETGDFFRHFARKWGSVTTVDASFDRFRNTASWPNMGYNLYNFVENGNEDEANLYQTPLANVVKSVVEYDGYEGRIPRAGVKLGDPNFELMHQSTVYLDSNWLEVEIFLCKVIRNDHKVVWKYFGQHHYSRTYNWMDQAPTTFQMVGHKGEQPEKDRLYERLVAAKKHLYNLLDGDTSYKYLLTEWGYDNWATAPPNEASINFGPPYFAFWTSSATPVIPGRDSAESKSIMMNRGELLIIASGIHGYNEFTIMNNNYNPSNSFPGLFATSGRGGAAIAPATGSNIYLPTKFKNYWSRYHFTQRILNYKFESLTRGADSLHIIKFRHAYSTDSVCYVIWKASLSGQTIPLYPLNVGNILGETANKWRLSFTSVAPVEVPTPVSVNKITVNVEEEPTYFFMKEVTPPVTPTNSYPKRKKVTIFKKPDE